MAKIQCGVKPDIFKITPPLVPCDLVGAVGAPSACQRGDVMVVTKPTWTGSKARQSHRAHAGENLPGSRGTRQRVPQGHECIYPEVLAQDLPCLGGAQLAIDVTLRSGRRWMRSGEWRQGFVGKLAGGLSSRETSIWMCTTLETPGDWKWWRMGCPLLEEPNWQWTPPPWSAFFWEMGLQEQAQREGTALRWGPKVLRFFFLSPA